METNARDVAAPDLDNTSVVGVGDAANGGVEQLAAVDGDAQSVGTGCGHGEREHALVVGSIAAVARSSRGRHVVTGHPQSIRIEQLAFYASSAHVDWQAERQVDGLVVGRGDERTLASPPRRTVRPIVDPTSVRERVEVVVCRLSHGQLEGAGCIGSAPHPPAVLLGIDVDVRDTRSAGIEQHSIEPQARPLGDFKADAQDAAVHHFNWGCVLADSSPPIVAPGDDAPAEIDMQRVSRRRPRRNLEPTVRFRSRG